MNGSSWSVLSQSIVNAEVLKGLGLLITLTISFFIILARRNRQNTGLLRDLTETEKELVDSGYIYFGEAYISHLKSKDANTATSSPVCTCGEKKLFMWIGKGEGESRYTCTTCGILRSDVFKPTPTEG